MTEILMLIAVASLLALAIGAVLAGIPLLRRLRRLLRDDARRDAAAGSWSMFEGDDA